MIPWHHHTITPTRGEHRVTAIIGIPCDKETQWSTGWMLLDGIYFWHPERAQFVSERSGKPPGKPHWYCLEDDLVAHLSARAHLAENGHGGRL
jgi:hypothetical protein